MANKTVTVRPSGGTYTSLQAAITGEVAANANLVTMDGILTISIEGSWSSADTASVTIAGFTVDATHYINITTDAANRAGISWDDSKYRLIVGSYANAITINNNYCRFVGLQLQKTQLNPVVDVAGLSQTFDSVLVRSSIQSGFYISGGGAPYEHKFINVVAIGNGDDHIGFNTASDNGTCYFYNCMALNYGRVGFDLSPNRSSHLVNCYAAGSNSGDINTNNSTSEIVNCATSDLTGSEGLRSIPYSTATFTNVTAGSEDFALSTGSALIGVGTDLSADAVYPFNWDITGATRTTWDVGVYYYAATTGIVIPVVIQHLRNQGNL
jgi:hypothetical protein